MNQSTRHNQNESSVSAPQPNPNISHFPELFVSFSLPSRAPVMRAADGTKTSLPAVQWERRNGNRTLTLTAGHVLLPGTHEKLNILPSGKIAVLILHWLCTEAVRAGGPEIDLATSWRGFLRDIKFSWNPRNAREAERQLRALLAMRIDTTTVGVDADGEETIHTTSCVVGSETKLTFTLDGDLNEKKSQVVLSQEFYDRVVSHWPVPHGTHRWEQLVASTKSPQTLLMWLWLKHRLHFVDQSGTKNLPVISWEELAEQMGPDITSMKKFRESFIKSAREIAAVDPNLMARVERVDQRGTGKIVRGIRLHPKNTITRYKNIAS